ncbi:hypothetical protein [Dyella sedimenti]|uniref:hypothetical protein n=1 Tax=Dyella sedimenti TaxID=2919947 RepID=UPI001FAA3056|nr:hypothetical protein [Dyella sedimenti]
MTWQAHGLRHGLSREIEHWLWQGADVLVNGSRAALPLANARFEQLGPVLITASRETMASRLCEQGGGDGRADRAARGAP